MENCLQCGWQGGGGCIYKKVRLIFSSGKQQLEPPPPTISLSLSVNKLLGCVGVPSLGREGKHVFICYYYLQEILVV
jgi:hypothetical protein